MIRPVAVVSIVFWIAFSACAQQITVTVAPFDSTGTGNQQIGLRASSILNLQIWQTLRVPLRGDGQKSKGGVTWDITSKPPTSYLEADALAGTEEENPQLVLWGRAWKYGDGTVVEAFLLIRSDARKKKLTSDFWTVSFPGGRVFSVSFPRDHVEFAPIVLRPDVLPELSDPAGLRLYTGPTGNETRGYVGAYFKALEQGTDAAKVVLPNGTVGWVRLPNLSSKPSEVVQFTGGLTRILRHDWEGASRLLKGIANDSSVPTAVRIDSFLYLAIAADETGQDAYPIVRQAYQLDPYSSTVVKYLCMAQLAAIARLNPSDQSARRAERLKSLSRIVASSQVLFPHDDPWFNALKNFLEEGHGF